MGSSRIYSTLSTLLSHPMVSGTHYSEYVQAEPVHLEQARFTLLSGRLATIRDFFRASLSIFRTTISGGHSPYLRELLLNDAPSSLRTEFHQRLPSEAWDIPRFFRTDESRDGRILELQCPGSGWGDLQLLKRAYEYTYPNDALSRFSPLQNVAQEIVQMTGTAEPGVLHLLDNASNPVSMRVLMAATMPPLRYWGYGDTLRSEDCSFIRSHSFFGLVAENLFQNRLRRLVDGLLLFDLPPIVLFDQKITLCLPFLDETRDLFADEIRSILAYSYPITEDGFRDVDDKWVSIADFLRRPPRERRYFLKYAGCDVNINWGSRAVYRLNGKSAEALLADAVADSRRGRPWLIQPELSTKEKVSYFDKETDSILDGTFTAKCSCFYGSQSLIGYRTMHRRHYKVHGQADTIIGIFVPGFHLGE